MYNVSSNTDQILNIFLFFVFKNKFQLNIYSKPMELNFICESSKVKKHFAQYAGSHS